MIPPPPYQGGSRHVRLSEPRGRLYQHQMIDEHMLTSTPGARLGGPREVGG